MKFKTRETMVIRGDAQERPAAWGDDAHPLVSAVLRVSPQQAWGTAGEGRTAEGRAEPEPTHLLTISVPRPDGAPAPVGHLALDTAPESWIPLGRDFDSLQLPPSAGILFVGVNELGWVVYDWTPGP